MSVITDMVLLTNARDDSPRMYDEFRRIRATKCHEG